MRAFGRPIAVAIAGAAIAMTGCTGPGTSESLAAATRLGTADLAFYITQWVNGRTPSGRVVLYDRTGPTSMVTNSGIEGNGLIWDGAGLFFIDQTDDFQLTDSGLERHRRSRDAGSVLGMRGDEHGRRVVLFNDGLADGHAHTGVALYEGAREQSQHDLVDSTAFAIASCQDGFYLAGPNTALPTTSELVRLDPTSRAPQRIGASVAGEFLDDRAGAPCSQDQVIGLWSPFLNGPVSSVPMEVWRWNTRDGDVQRAPLKTTQGAAFGLDPKASSAGMPRWLDGDDLLWVDATGTGWRTNLTTGLTRKVREGMIAYRGPIDHWVLNGDYLIGFEYLPDKVTGHLRVYSARTMELLETRELPRLAEVTPEGQQVLAIAVRPGYRPGANG